MFIKKYYEAVKKRKRLEQKEVLTELEKKELKDLDNKIKEYEEAELDFLLDNDDDEPY